MYDYRKAFTLIELLVVIAIIAILSVVVILSLNPAQLLAQSRDASRLSDMATITSALNLYVTDQGTASSFSLGHSSTTYISIPDPSATSTAGDQCQGLGMSSSTTWHCESSSTYRNVSSTGWIPVNLSLITSGSPIGNLPIDPKNQTSTNFFYSYATNGSNFEISSNPESQKYITLEASNTNMFNAGSNLTLISGSLGSGSVSQANMKMSLVNGTAFVDFGTAGSFTSYIGDKITISDSLGHQLVGWIKAVGTGETYGSQLLPYPAMDSLSAFYAQNASNTILGSGCQAGSCLQLITTAAYGEDLQYFSVTSGMLLQSSAYLEKGTETSWLQVGIINASYSQITPAYYSALPSTWTQYIQYATADSTGGFNQFYVGATSGKTSLFDTASVEQVLTPSITGATIVSTQGGSTYNWTSEQSGFNRNDSSGYTYSITPS